MKAKEIPKYKGLSVLVVTYNSKALIGTLLEKLAIEREKMVHLAQIPMEVIVVDNASRDGTAAYIAAQFPWVKLVPSQVNLGFAAGNNLAAKHATGDIFLLLNPDAIPDPDALMQGYLRLSKSADIGVVGGALRDAGGGLQPPGRMFPSVLDEWFVLSGLANRFPNNRLLARMDRLWSDAQAEADVDWVSGAFIFVKAALFTGEGGFDERFFMYSEEVDLCRRLHAQGWRVCYWPQLSAMHIGGASALTVTGQQVSKSGTQLELWRMRGLFLYYRKHHGLWGAWGLLAMEWGWHKLRAFKALIYVDKQKRTDFGQHIRLLRQAWRDTRGGLVSPQTPW